jgi:hypothetical protein
MKLASWAASGALLAALVGSAPCFADAGGRAMAEVLFEEGKALLEQGEIEPACQKLAESHRLDPATGTLLGLALCHEQQGKLASAWSEFVEVEAAAARDRQEDREAFARERAAEIRARLSTLKIEVAPETATLNGLQVTRNGVVLGASSFNVAAPVDGGDHTIEVTAPGKSVWSVTVHIPNERAQETVAIGVLEDEPVAAAPAAVDETAGPAATPEERRRDPFDFTPLQWTGVGTAGAGVVALGVGGYFLMTALDQKEESDGDCDGNQCGEAGTNARNEAIDSGNLATIFGIAGGALVGVGATLFFVGSPSDGAAADGGVTFSAVANGSGAFARLRGSF